MIVVASANGRAGIREAMQVLRAGGSAIDAVEAGIRLVESNPEDHSVGYSGYPNILGQVELDASIMDGATLAAGAVGAVKGFEHPISIARKIMETIFHVMLVGEGAERFAREMGFVPRDMLSPEAREVWEKRLREDMSPEEFDHLYNLPNLSRWVRLATDPGRAGGTVNFIAQDANGNLCAGVSTSGWAWKYPGRLGDSPIIGAGNYADNRYGAATCTGMGEMAIRAGTACSVVLYMKMGMPVEEACLAAMQDLKDLGGKYLNAISILAIDRDGHPAGYTNYHGDTFVTMTGEMDEPAREPRIFFQTAYRWERE